MTDDYLRCACAVVTEPGQRCGAAMETGDARDVMSPSNAINVVTRSDGYLASSVTMETGRGGPSCPWHIQVMGGLCEKH